MRTKASRRYHPSPPETPSTFSVWAVRLELAITALLALSVIIVVRPEKEEPVPAFTIQAPVGLPPVEFETQATGLDSPDPLKGQALFMQSCTSCHGQNAQGLPRMGVNLRGSEFVASSSDLRLIAFLKRGRQAIDPRNSTGVPMPARGGNLTLDDESLADIVAFLRQVQQR